MNICSCNIYTLSKANGPKNGKNKFELDDQKLELLRYYYNPK